MEDEESFTKKTMLPIIGEYGRFQWLLNALFCMIYIPTSYQILIMYFCTMKSSWVCIGNTSCSLNGTQDPDDVRRCDMPRHTWKYTEDQYFSIITQFDIPCKDEWLIDLLTSIYFLGVVCGGIINGWVADKYGRRILILPYFSLNLIFGLIYPFMPNIYMVIACRFIVGMAFNGILGPMLTLLSEVVGSKYSSLSSCLVFSSFPLATCILALKSYLVKDWKILSIICTAPFIPLLFFSSFIPESIEWLLLQNEKEKVMALYKKIASWNKKSIPTTLDIPVNTQRKQTLSLVNLFKPFDLAKRTLVQGYLWFVIAAGYFGLQLAAGELGNSKYRDFVILVLTDLPSFFISVVLCNKLDRKKATLLPLLIGALLCLSLSIIPTTNSYKYIRISVGILGKMLFSIAYNNVYVWFVELFPTGVRSKALGFMAACTSFGSALAPWMADQLFRFGVWCPFVALSVPSIMGFVLAVLLPDGVRISNFEKKDYCCTVTENMHAKKI